MRNRSLIALCFAAPALFHSTTQAASIELEPSSASFAVGESVLVDVVAKNLFDSLPPGDELVGFGFDIDVTPDGLVGPTGLALTPDLMAPFTDLGTFTEVVAVAGLESITGVASAVLATLELTALSPGMLTLAVTADPTTNPNHGLAFLSTVDPLDFDDASVALTVTAAPLPGTAALLGLGLLALVRRRRA
jgi:uncharacterized protein (TIGR03382 family)